MFKRLKRLWKLSALPTEEEDRALAEKIQEHHTFTVKSRKKRDQQLAKIIDLRDPLDVFPSGNSDQHDTTR